MNLLNEFIFDDEKNAKKFINNMSELYYSKGYLSYGDVCKYYFNDNIDYNKYNVYTDNGWISISIFEVVPYSNKFKVRFPNIIKIKQKLKENN